MNGFEAYIAIEQSFKMFPQEKGTTDEPKVSRTNLVASVSLRVEEYLRLSSHLEDISFARSSYVNFKYKWG